ncbi:hypothetical protein HYV72_02075 [Candidatus Uhrbacteria bacterium]|nr:hypothetical protein [Candidatus Uhrbacteria bacterium]
MTDVSRRSTSFFQRLRALYPLWSVLCVVMIVVSVSLYAVQMTEAAKQGYQLRDLEQEVSVLRLESERLSARIAEGKSLVHVSERMQILGFVPVGKVVYAGGRSSVARSD